MDSTLSKVALSKYPVTEKFIKVTLKRKTNIIAFVFQVKTFPDDKPLTHYHLSNKQFSRSFYLVFISVT